MNHPERDDQIALVKYIRAKYPKVKLMMAPIVKYEGDAKSRAIQGRIMAAMGFEEGQPDLCIPEPRGRYRGFAIELKAKGRSMSAVKPKQAEYLLYLDERGWKVCIAFDHGLAVKAVDRYMERGE